MHFFGSQCQKYLKQLKLNLTFDEIMNMQTSKFKKLLKQQITEEAFNYLMINRKVKGSQIKYSKLQTGDYIMPNKIITCIEDKKLIFNIRNELLFPSFGEPKICKCKNKLNTLHLYECKILNSEEKSINFDRIFDGNLKEIKFIISRIKHNLQQF